MSLAAVVLPALIAGLFSTVLGASCLLLSGRLGERVARLQRRALGERPGVDAAIWTGLACVAAVLYLGIGLALLAAALG